MSQRCRLLFALCVVGGLSVLAARADAPPSAAAAVHRLMAAYQANDRAAFLAALADDYRYNGLRKADLNPFGSLWVLNDRLLYRIAHLVEARTGAATAIVDTHFTGRFNLEALNMGQPPVSGSSRLWIEVRRQRDGQWRVSALRPVRLRFVHADTLFTWVEALSVNAASSLEVAPGTALNVEGRTSFGLRQFVAIGTVSKPLSLHLEPREPWTVALEAPADPGRYYVDAVSVTLAPREDSGLYLAWDQMTVPVTVR